MPRILCVLSLCATALAGYLLGPVGSSSAAARCAQSRSVTVLQNRYGRVSRVPFSPTRGVTFWRYYGCLFSRNQLYRIDGRPQVKDFSTKLSITKSVLALGPTYVGFGWESPAGVQVVLASIDLRTGKPKYVTTLDSPSADGDSTVTADTLVMNRGGALAWVVTNTAFGGAWNVVGKHDGTGARVLDTTPHSGGNPADIPPRSLSLRGSTVSWLHSGTQMQATLS